VFPCLLCLVDPGRLIEGGTCTTTTTSISASAFMRMLVLVLVLVLVRMLVLVLVLGQWCLLAPRRGHCTQIFVYSFFFSIVPCDFSLLGGGRCGTERCHAAATTSLIDAVPARRTSASRTPPTRSMPRTRLIALDSIP